MQVKRAFVRENRARQVEQAHTRSLTRAQRYALAELRMLYAGADDDLRRQIAVLDAVFQQPVTRPAVRKALNRMRRERLTGHALMEGLTQLYRDYNLDAARRPRPDPSDEDNALPTIVCSEGLVG
jgi:hypothetical protein